MSVPKVTVVTAYFNRCDHVTESVRSIVHQAGPEVEVLLVDDGSTDGTLDRLREFEGERVRVVTHANMGFVDTMRHAIDLARGAYVAVHGSGDISLPGRFESQADYLDRHPETGVVGCWTELVNLRGELVRMHRPDFGDDASASLLGRNQLMHGDVMFRRDLYEKVGGYRPAFRFGQDYDLWLRMSLHARFGVVPELLYRRFWLPDGAGADPEKMVVSLFLNEFARECFRERRVKGRDALDRQGVQAFLARRRSFALSSRILRLGFVSWDRRGLDRSFDLFRLAAQESFHPLSMAVYGGLRLLASAGANSGRLDRVFRSLTGLRRKTNG